jgi:hypothetical protein
LPLLLDLLGCHETTPPDTGGPEWPVSGAPDSEG